MPKRTKRTSPKKPPSDLTYLEIEELEKCAVEAVLETLGLVGQAKTFAELDKLLSAESREFDVDLSEVPDWFTPPFFATGFRLDQCQSKTKHRMGGRVPSPIPKCANCAAALLLFANLDTTDPRLASDYPWKRLPLLYCCSCPGPIHYRPLGEGRIAVLPSQVGPYDESPFSAPPKQIATGFLNLREITAAMESAAETAERFAMLSQTQRRLLAQLLGRKPSGRWDLYFSQLGGFPRSYQGGEGVPSKCPNTYCRNRRRKRNEFKYRPLAVLDLWSDHFWGMRSDAVQIVFSICPGCFSIAAKYTCT